MTTTMVAGIGNIFLGDDAFGVELARRLTAETLPDGVKVADYGIRGMHLAYDLLEMAPDTTILLDAVSRGGDPGTLYVLEIGSGDVPGIEPSAVDAHGMTPDAVLAAARGALCWLDVNRSVPRKVSGCPRPSPKPSTGRSVWFWICSPTRKEVKGMFRLLRRLVFWGSAIGLVTVAVQVSKDVARYKQISEM
jgi:hydrogenase maturation protease